MGVETLLMLVGDVAPTSWPPYVTVAAFYGESFAAGSRVGLALDLVSLLQFKMDVEGLWSHGNAVCTQTPPGDSR